MRLRTQVETCSWNDCDHLEGLWLRMENLRNSILCMLRKRRPWEGKWSSSRANHREWCRRTGFSWRQKLPGLRMVGPITLATSLLPTHPVVAQSSSCNVCPSDSHKKVEKFPIVHGLHKRSRPTHLLHLFSFFLPASSSLPSLRFLR